MAAEGMDLLWKMSHGTVKGFSLYPAKPAIQAAILSKDHAEKAIDTFGNLSGADVQQRLAGLVLDNTLDKKLRLLSTYKLQQHILKHGLVLNKVQIAGLRDAHTGAMDPDLRKLLSLIMTQLPPSEKGGPKLSDFTPKPVK
jgi:hypothetical protein